MRRLYVSIMVSQLINVFYMREGRAIDSTFPDLKSYVRLEVVDLHKLSIDKYLADSGS